MIENRDDMFRGKTQDWVTGEDGRVRHSKVEESKNGMRRRLG